MPSGFVDPKWEAFKNEFDAKQDGEALEVVLPMQDGRRLRAKLWENGNHRTVEPGMGGAWAEELGSFKGVDGLIWQHQLQILYSEARVEKYRAKFKEEKERLNRRSVMAPPTQQELDKLAWMRDQVTCGQMEGKVLRSILADLEDQKRYPGKTVAEIQQMRKAQAEAEAEHAMTTAERMKRLAEITL